MCENHASVKENKKEVDSPTFKIASIQRVEDCIKKSSEGD